MTPVTYDSDGNVLETASGSSLVNLACCPMAAKPSASTRPKISRRWAFAFRACCRP
ncbi:MAG: hypothetical protein WKG07_09230 [Hymenobacter sp.]